MAVIRDENIDDNHSDKNFGKSSMLINSLSWKRFSTSAQKKKMEVHNATISNRVSILRTSPLDNVHPILDNNKNIDKSYYTLKANDYFEPTLKTRTNLRPPLTLTVAQKDAKGIFSSLSSGNLEKNHLASNHQPQNAQQMHTGRRNQNSQSSMQPQSKLLNNKTKKTVVQASTSELLRCLGIFLYR